MVIFTWLTDKNCLLGLFPTETSNIGVLPLLYIFKFVAQEIRDTPVEVQYLVTFKVNGRLQIQKMLFFRNSYQLNFFAYAEAATGGVL